MVNLIVAMDQNRVIGAAGKLPWHLPADLKRFKALTLGHPIVMGRKTFESIGRPLPGRTNVVVTRQQSYQAVGCTVVHSLEAAFEAVRGHGEVFLIGGGELFEQAMGIADRIYATEIDTAVVGGDAYFPAIDFGRWTLLERVDCKPDPKNPYSYAYVTYVKKA